MAETPNVSLNAGDFWQYLVAHLRLDWWCYLSVWSQRQAGSYSRHVSLYTFLTPSPLPSPRPHRDYNTRLLLVWGGVELQPNRNSVKINVTDQGKREENNEQKVWLPGQSHEGVWCYYLERQSSGKSPVESGSLVSGLGWLCGCNYTNYSVFFCSPAFPLCTQL